MTTTSCASASAPPTAPALRRHARRAATFRGGRPSRRSAERTPSAIVPLTVDLADGVVAMHGDAPRSTACSPAHPAAACLHPPTSSSPARSGTIEIATGSSGCRTRAPRHRRGAAVVAVSRSRLTAGADVARVAGREHRLGREPHLLVVDAELVADTRAMAELLEPTAPADDRRLVRGRPRGSTTPRATGRRRRRAARAVVDTRRAASRRRRGRADPADRRRASRAGVRAGARRGRERLQPASPRTSPCSICSAWCRVERDVRAMVAALGRVRAALPDRHRRDGPVEIDLVEDGPHVLIAGTTGSGKSELLQSAVTALAARYSPQRVNFLFVDYKGGAATKVFEGLTAHGGIRDEPRRPAAPRRSCRCAPS